MLEICKKSKHCFTPTLDQGLDLNKMRQRCNGNTRWINHDIHEECDSNVNWTSMPYFHQVVHISLGCLSFDWRSYVISLNLQLEHRHIHLHLLHYLNACVAQPAGAPHEPHLPPEGSEVFCRDGLRCSAAEHSAMTFPPPHCRSNSVPKMHPINHVHLLFFFKWGVATFSDHRQHLFFSMRIWRPSLTSHNDHSL